MRLVRLNIRAGTIGGSCAAVLLEMARWGTHQGRSVTVSNERIGENLIPPKSRRSVSRAKSELRAQGWIFQDGHVIQNGHKNERWAISLDRLYECAPLGLASAPKPHSTSAPKWPDDTPEIRSQLVRQNGQSLGRQNGAQYTTPQKSVQLDVLDAQDSFTVPFSEDDPITQYVNSKLCCQRDSAGSSPRKGGGGGRNPQTIHQDQPLDIAEKRTTK